MTAQLLASLGIGLAFFATAYVSAEWIYRLGKRNEAIRRQLLEISRR